MANGGPLRVGLDAHVVGRRQTGNETYIVELASALARRCDVLPIAYLDARTVWPRQDAPLSAPLRWQFALPSDPARIAGPGQT